LFRHHGEVRGEADTLDSLGYIAHRTGDHLQALGHYQEALKLCRDANDASHEVNTLDHLGETRAALGQPDQARAAWEQALELYRAQHRTADAERVRQQLDDLRVPGSSQGLPQIG
jgi:tetratricopeptide (TPR) repeat protein